MVGERNCPPESGGQNDEGRATGDSKAGVLRPGNDPPFSFP